MASIIPLIELVIFEQFLQLLNIMPGIGIYWAILVVMIFMVMERVRSSIRDMLTIT